MSADNDFERAMRQMGVRPLRAEEERLRGNTRSESKPAQSTRQPTPTRKAKEGQLKKAEGAREADSVELGALREENRVLREENTALSRKLHALQAELDGLTSFDDRGVETIQGVLQDWNIRGGRDLDTWMDGLVSQGRLAECLSYLKVGHAGLLRKLVDETSLFHCGRSDCIVPSGMVALPVDEEDCEQCGGLEFENWGARLSDALLLNGCRKVVLRGHRVALLRQLASQMDPRIEVQVVGLSVRFSSSDPSAWVALWRRTGDDTNDIEADCRVKAASLGQWVTRVIYRLEKE